MIPLDRRYARRAGALWTRLDTARLRRQAAPGVRVGPGRDAGALLTRQESRAHGRWWTAEARLGEPARFPLSLAALPRLADATSIDLYIELI